MNIKSLFLMLLASMFSVVCYGQNTKTRLVIRVDDMGSSQSSNMATMATFKNGIATSAEVMAVGAWFPEAVRLANANPTIDIGLHLALTSEWDNIKWRPLTVAPSLVDENGYFFPMIAPNPNYPEQSILENDWKLDEIEKEFRAQINFALKNIPHISHLSSHMGCMSLDKSVEDMVRRLAKEYNLADISTNPTGDYALIRTSYDGPHKTFAEKEASFLSMLDKLEQGKSYFFVDHPAYNDAEMQAVHHIGYKDVAIDRQGVTDLLTSDKVKQKIAEKGIELISYSSITNALPRSTTRAEKVDSKGIDNYLKAVEKSGQDLHSLMLLRHGKVVFERWFGDNAPDKNHIVHSISKTYTSMAVGFAVAENRLSLNDKVIKFFPDDLPPEVSPYLADLEIRHLLTMTAGHAAEPAEIRKTDGNWERQFLATPIVYKPGSHFSYSSLSSFMLSSIIQRITGEKLADYLYPRLFRPLGITGIEYLTNPDGVNTGGWGMFLKTEDMAKLGQFLLQKGKWNGVQILPASYIEEASSRQVYQDDKKKNDKSSDWLQGYGYQMWRCRHNAFRADGANGQFIIVVPDKDAVIITTANINDMQAEINLIWKYILPAFK